MRIDSVIDNKLDLIKPTFSRVLVQKLDTSVTEGGIILAVAEEEDQDNTLVAKVLDLGPTCLSPSTLIGKLIIIGKYSGVELSKGKGIILINEQDILAVL